ncbi:MAG: threonine--tRNA ligase [Candidatus Marinimicrobia bacterium]|nr:threonine--tRNA ligase [Candidatus Neomarinimicrobiota bacterium]MCF7850675.1 threonine--tRNA ligase [Candidatus Neomarinimicrobiota bacterium]MCF7904478.1 threonine--tRNA ligase [Candidatus Neomarinimicrobiota bacterium]
MNANGNIQITYPDGKIEEMPSGIRAFEIAQKISPQFEKQLIAAKVNDTVVDLKAELTDDADIVFIKRTDAEAHDILLHSTSHIMAQAVKRLYPDVKVTIGPSIENGFYYDFDIEKPFTDEQLAEIEAEMQKIVEEDLPVERMELSRDEAIKRFDEMNEDYKVEIISELPEDEVISAYEQGEFIDLCRGPHIPSTKRAGAFKLLSVAGAYWRGDEKNRMLSRIYGTAFPDKKALKKYLHLLEEAKKRDHRRLGKELGWFSFHNDAPANAFFHAKGTAIYNSIMNFVRESNTAHNYEEVNTPLIMSADMWKQSGHYDNYRENMYFTKIDDRDFAVKPMNCPGHTLVYGDEPRSYRDLPIKMSEFGRVHRHEKSGVTHGLFRVRTFIQDDAHVFCTENQIQAEVDDILDQVYEVYSVFGFENVHVELSTRPEKSIGSQEVWDKSESALESVLKARGIDYQLNPGDGAFYGPKIDFHIKDSLNRSWQCGTVQLDFSMPERFGLVYTGEDGQDHQPVMIHRAIVGSLERFMGILIEHYAARMPVWLAPVQVKVIPIADRHEDYAQAVVKELKALGVRVEANWRNDKIGQKIRQAELEKIPYMFILGDREVDEKKVSVRRHGSGDLGSQDLSDIGERILNETRERADQKV